jgi:hypothetical protein
MHTSCAERPSFLQEQARNQRITVITLDKGALEEAQKAANWSGSVILRRPRCVVQAAFSLAKKLQPCIVLLGKAPS